MIKQVDYSLRIYRIRFLLLALLPFLLSCSNHQQVKGDSIEEWSLNLEQSIDDVQ